jgi:stage V sporulation protein B
MNKNTLGKGTIYITIASLVFIFSGYIINIWLGRYLGPASYGIYGLIITLMGTINLTQTAGLPLAISKYVAEKENEKDSILTSGLFVQGISTIVIMVLFYLLSGVIASFFNDTSLIPYLQLTALIFPIYGIYSVFLNYYNGLHYFKTQALMSIVYSLAKLFCVIIFVYLFHVYGVIFAFILSPFIGMFFWIHIPRHVKKRFPYKKLIVFSIPLIFIAIFTNLLQSVDLYFIKALMHSNKAAGFYTANQNIAEIPFYGVAALASVLFPSISRQVSQNLTKEVKNLISKSLRFTLLISIPSVFIISATSLSVLRFLFSSSYSQGAVSLSILAIGNCFYTVLIILTTIISSSGSPVKSSILTGFAVVISCILCIYLIPLYGLSGAALATTCASCIGAIGAGVVVYRKFGVLFPLKSTGKIIFSSGIIYLLARFIAVPNIVLPVLYVVLFALYVAILFLLKEMTQDDIKTIVDFLPRVGKK